MRIYLGNCCVNRPFDDQGQVRIRLETEAKLPIQQQVSDGELDLVWSHMLDLENASNPFVRSWDVALSVPHDPGLALVAGAVCLPDMSTPQAVDLDAHAGPTARLFPPTVW